MLKLIPIVCPACNNQIYSGDEDNIFLCPRCATLHARNGKIYVIDYEVGSTLKHAEGEKLYRPFWKLGVDFEILSMSTDGSLRFKLSNFLSPGSSSGHVDMIFPAFEVDPPHFMDFIERLMLQPAKYTPGRFEPGAKRERCVVTVDMVRDVADFAFLLMQAGKPGTMTHIAYDLHIKSRKLLYLPFYKKYDQYTLETSYMPGY